MKSSAQLEDAIFYAALNIADAAARKVFLDQACMGDAALRAAVEELLAAQAPAERFFSESGPALKLPAEALPSRNGEGKTNGSHHIKLPEEEQLGTRVGRYRLAQKIGEGGCGNVYLADQEEPVRRNVALKIIKLGMDTKSVIARFGAERQALAMMDHANIARVFDAGTTDKGRPYFVMELVRGEKITDYCDGQKLDCRRRLELFIEVCHAIQHAHQKGIIHRDIKPSNILVAMESGKPVPKVIDFGIAKAMTEQPLTDGTAFTAHEQFIGTPAYISPEQAQTGTADTDTRSDIYSLGVLLYELLTGRTPFDGRSLMEGGVDEMRRILREQEPPRPSSMVASLTAEDLAAVAQRRRVETGRLAAMLRGDLDWIVMKALEKDRGRRYETASELALDVQRHLDNEPVLASPPSRVYQFRKLVRRNKAAFAGAAAVGVTLILGLSVSTSLYLSERQALQQAEQERIAEAQLRGHAEAREKITQAAIAVNRGEFSDADALVRQVPANYFYPSLEAANVFRSLGEWHASNGRWKDAAFCFNALLQVDVFENGKSDAATQDLLEAGPPLIESGDLDAYEDFRREAARRFADTTNAVAAERVLRASLLAPGNPMVLRRLGVFAKVVEKSLGDGKTDGTPAGWSPVSLAMMEYRGSNWTKAAEWCRVSLAATNDAPARMATTYAILALCDQRLGRNAEAASELSRGLNLSQTQTGTGFWYEWSICGILLREAGGTVEPAAKPAGVARQSDIGFDEISRRTFEANGAYPYGGSHDKAQRRT